MTMKFLKTAVMAVATFTMASTSFGQTTFTFESQAGVDAFNGQSNGALTVDFITLSASATATNSSGQTVAATTSTDISNGIAVDNPTNNGSTERRFIDGQGEELVISFNQPVIINAFNFFGVSSDETITVTVSSSPNPFTFSSSSGADNNVNPFGEGFELAAGETITFGGVTGNTPRYALETITVTAVATGGGGDGWVDFVDERSRLQFDTDDDQEKDMIVGDIDNDGDEDIVVVRKRPFSVNGPRRNLLLMNENGNLVDRTADFIPTFLSDTDNARDVHLFDANNDGWLDIAVANTFGSLPRFYVNLGNNASGAWRGYEDQGSNGEWYSPQLPTNPQACGMAIGDVNGDGLPDLYYVDYANSLEARLFINNGDLTFTDETEDRLSDDARDQAFGTTAVFADMNGDGAIDIVSNDSEAFGGVGVEIAYNDGDGNFMQTQVLASTVLSYMVQMVDMNNDGRLDIYVVDDLQDYVFRNDSTNGNGTINVTRIFNTQSSLTTDFNGNVLACDMDNDGWDDMIVSDVDVDIPGCDRRFTLLRNMNGSNFQNPFNGQLQNFNVQGSHDAVVIDINQDGNKDLFIATCEDYHMFVSTFAPTGNVPIPVDPPSQFFDLNGDFRDGLSGWTIESGNIDLSGRGHDDDISARLRSSGARLSRQVNVLPNTNYRLRGRIETNGRFGYELGGNRTSSTASGAARDYKRRTFEFNTGNNNSITIFCEWRTRTGRFDNITLENLDGTEQ